MNNFRLVIAAIGCIIIAMLAYLLAGCSGLDLRPECRHDAVRCALTAGERYGFGNVGIVGGVTRNGQKHAQAFVVIDGKEVLLDGHCLPQDDLAEKWERFTIAPIWAWYRQGVGKLEVKP